MLRSSRLAAKAESESLDALSTLANTVVIVASSQGQNTAMKRPRTDDIYGSVEGAFVEAKLSEDSGHSAASTDERHDLDSDGSHHMDNSESDDREFGIDEVEAVSSLATIFCAVGKEHRQRVRSHRLNNTGEADRRCRNSFPSQMKSEMGVKSNEDLDVQVKKQRRREKNRASAQQSRQRKKCHLEALESRVNQLEQERAALHAQMRALRENNEALRIALAQVQTSV